MRVLFIHEHGRAHGGGAVTAMYKLHRALLLRGVESVIACRRRELNEPEIIELPSSPRLENALGVLSWRIGLNDIHCVSTFKIRKWKPFLDTDIVNIHGWHTNFFNYLALPALARRKPIVSTMHDLWPITGHCAMSDDCQRFLTGCGHCPYLKNFPPVGRDATALEWKLKKRVYDRSRITFVSPSRWLMNLAVQGMLRNHDVRQIPNPVDTSIYRPTDRRAARDALGLPQDRYIIFFIAVSLADHRKGGELLLRALQALPDRVRERTLLLTLGGNADEFASAAGFPALSFGYVHDEQRKALMYAAADLTAQPSRAENQSLVILESLACGVPVVAFDIGGNREIVEAGPGGLLCEPENHLQFSHAMASILENQQMREELSRNARDSAVRNYSLDLHAERYLQLFQERIEAFSRARGYARA